MHSYKLRAAGRTNEQTAPMTCGLSERNGLECKIRVIILHSSDCRPNILITVSGLVRKYLFQYRLVSSIVSQNQITLPLLVRQRH
jgi:hypothetical protein